MNIKILEQILTSNHSYWLIEKNYKDFRDKILSSCIVMIVIPPTINRGVERSKIKLIDLERLNSIPLDGNIYLNGEFTPFQYHLTLNDVDKIYPIQKNIFLFLKKALDLNSNEFNDYIDLIHLIDENN